jgi:hypothetical protein
MPSSSNKPVPSNGPKLPAMDPIKQQEFDKELNWCIHQLELGLKRENADAEQQKESKAVILKLKSTNINFIQKRQLMRVVFGNNYKILMKQMEEEQQGDEKKKQLEEEKRTKKKEKKKLAKLQPNQKENESQGATTDSNTDQTSNTTVQNA